MNHIILPSPAKSPDEQTSVTELQYEAESIQPTIVRGNKMILFLDIEFCSGVLSSSRPPKYLCTKFLT